MNEMVNHNWFGNSKYSKYYCRQVNEQGGFHCKFEVEISNLKRKKPSG